MLRKIHEKKEKTKYEYYYNQKIEELWKSKSNGKALILEEDDNDGRVEVWSTDSEDEEIWRPTHGKGFIVKEDKIFDGGKCLMVGSTDSEIQEYFTNEGANWKFVCQ